jgi:hypothetical protein
MPTFGLITEGLTDQEVVRAVAEGVFGAADTFVNPLQPVADKTFSHLAGHFSNWELVLNYCSSPQFADAFAFNDYVIVQIDTDRCEEPAFGVPKFEADRSLDPFEIAWRTALVIMGRIDPSVARTFGERVLFAISVETIECWLLPLYALGDQRRKHLNCLNALNRALRKRNETPISPDAKDPRRYSALAEPYTHRRNIETARGANVSLDLFVRQLESARDNVE